MSPGSGPPPAPVVPDAPVCTGRGAGMKRLSTERHRGRGSGLATVNRLPFMRQAVRCPSCDEVYGALEPCRCEREVLRRAPPPAADEAGTACVDSQHYACSGYLRPERWEWRRCLCGCHEIEGEAENPHLAGDVPPGPRLGRAHGHGGHPWQWAPENSMEVTGMLEVGYEKTSEYVICRAVGELDGANASRLRDVLTRHPAPERLVIDLSGVSFVDSAGLGALIGGIRRTREASGEVAISTSGSGVTRVLQTAGFDRIVPVEPTVEAAAAALSGPEASGDTSAA